MGAIGIGLAIGRSTPLNMAARDVRAHAARVVANGGAPLSSLAMGQLTEFTRFLYERVGRVDYIPFRTAHNIGTGTSVLSLHGRVGQLHNGAGWTSGGIYTDKASTQVIRFLGLSLGPAASIVCFFTGSAANTGSFAALYSLQAFQNYASGVMWSEQHSSTYILANAVGISPNFVNSNTGGTMLVSSSPSMFAARIEDTASGMTIKVRNIDGAIQSNSINFAHTVLNLDRLILSGREVPAGFHVPATLTHSLVALTPVDLMDATFLNDLNAKYLETLGS